MNLPTQGESSQVIAVNINFVTLLKLKSNDLQQLIRAKKLEVVNHVLNNRKKDNQLEKSERNKTLQY